MIKKSSLVLFIFSAFNTAAATAYSVQDAECVARLEAYLTETNAYSKIDITLWNPENHQPTVTEKKALSCKYNYDDGTTGTACYAYITGSSKAKHKDFYPREAYYSNNGKSDETVSFNFKTVVQFYRDSITDPTIRSEIIDGKNSYTNPLGYRFSNKFKSAKYCRDEAQKNCRSTSMDMSELVIQHEGWSSENEFGPASHTINQHKCHVIN